MITPRAEERKAVVALLEQDWDSADQLAGALIKAMFELLQKRELRVVLARQEGVLSATLFGPFATEGDAKRAVGKSWLSVGGGEARIIELYAVTKLALSEPVPDKTKCGTCGHGKGEHTFPKMHGKCANGFGPRKTTACECKEFT